LTQTDSQQPDNQSNHLSYIHYIEWRNKLYEASSKAWETLSKNLLYLSSGALVLSITLVDFLEPEGKPLVAIELLKMSWVSFTIVLAFSLISAGTTIFTAHDLMRKWDEAYEKEQKPDECSCANLITAGIFIISFLVFMLGIIMLLSFAWLNIGIENGKN
jgi:hypothetical protein